MEPGDIAYVTFKDYSQKREFFWAVQSYLPDVRLYWCMKNRAWCREVNNVKCRMVNGWYLPINHPIITYSKKIE